MLLVKSQCGNEVCGGVHFYRQGRPASGHPHPVLTPTLDEGHPGKTAWCVTRVKKYPRKKYLGEKFPCLLHDNSLRATRGVRRSLEAVMTSINNVFLYHRPVCA
jgi:hypothetical protein